MEDLKYLTAEEVSWLNERGDIPELASARWPGRGQNWESRPLSDDDLDAWDKRTVMSCVRLSGRS